MYYGTMPAFFNLAMKLDIAQEPYLFPSVYVCALCAFFDTACLSLALTLSAQECAGTGKNERIVRTEKKDDYLTGDLFLYLKTKNNEP